MMQSGRLAHLMARKAQLDAEVNKESSNVNPNHIRLTQLKRQKLQLKEEIERISASL